MQTLIAMLSTENAASALSDLTAESKKLASRKELDGLLGDRAAVMELLDDPSPKVRKNAARLLGALSHPEDAAALAYALKREQTRFVVPSLLLALGSVGGDCAREALAAYTPPDPEDETQRKHCAEIAEAYNKARSALAASDAAPLPVYEPAGVVTHLLVAPEGFSEMLLGELQALGYAPQPHPQGALVQTDNLQKLFRARCFTEALIPIQSGVALDPEAIAAASRAYLTLPWRIELRGYTGSRTDLIRALCAAIGPGNSPSRYALELRIVCHAALCDLYLRATSVPDGRFAYRRRAIPASIAPATAACLARLAADAWQQGQADASSHAAPRVLDPFCGSGTLLFELEKYIRCASLTGVDLSPNALSAARENAFKARSKAKLIQKDILKFEPGPAYDIVLSNLPFGNRVGTHENNKPLYRAFVARLPEFLAENGVAVLYTMEYELLMKCIQHTPALTLASTQRTEAGGLLPWIFVVKRTQQAK